MILHLISDKLFIIRFCFYKAKVLENNRSCIQIYAWMKYSTHVPVLINEKNCKLEVPSQSEI